VEIELYIPSSDKKRNIIDRFDLFVEIDLPFLPQENNIYHSVSHQKSYKVISVHFTNKRIMVIVKETEENDTYETDKKGKKGAKNCYDGLYVYKPFLGTLNEKQTL
jgi:hypothetical protein